MLTLSGARPGTVWGDACSMVSSTSNGRKIRPEIYGAKNYSMENNLKNFNSCMKHTRDFLKFTILKLCMTLPITNNEAEINFSQLSR